SGEVIAAIIGLHAVIRQYDEIVPVGQETCQLRQLVIHQLIDAQQGIAQIRFGRDVVHVGGVHVFPKKMTRFVSLAKHQEQMIEITAREQFPR
ncbi:hypothetical protein C1Y15_34965, partial [Pseudomonas sp. MPR-LB5]